MSHTTQAHWIFGYGSLIWRPGIRYIDKTRASLTGYSRRFWQGSHDHRGTPEKPGRVVTLIEDPNAICVGVAYLVEDTLIRETFETLDHREKNGYERLTITIEPEAGEPLSAFTYIAQQNNFAYLGPAPVTAIAQQIAASHGPSGANIDYLRELAHSLRELNANDPHIFELEAALEHLS